MSELDGNKQEETFMHTCAAIEKNGRFCLWPFLDQNNDISQASTLKAEYWHKSMTSCTSLHMVTLVVEQWEGFISAVCWGV